jgi:hypothetical protein
MDGFLKHQAGPQAHLWDMVVAEVFQPLGFFQAPMLHWPGAEGEPGLPHLSGGLFLTIDDLAQLATLLQHGGRHHDQQLLHAATLAGALYKTTAMGLPSGLETRFGAARYHLSFSSMPYRTATGCFFQIPYAAGRGGNVIILLPNGITAFQLADGDKWNQDTLVLAGEALRPFPCAAGSGEASLPARQPLTSSELRAELPGNTLYYSAPWQSENYNIFIATDGALYLMFQAEPDGGTLYAAGRWHITPEGHFCSRWWNDRVESCSTVSREGETFAFFPTGRLWKGVYRRAPGNPEGY